MKFIRIKLLDNERLGVFLPNNRKRSFKGE